MYYLYFVDKDSVYKSIKYQKIINILIFACHYTDNYKLEHYMLVLSLEIFDT